MKERQLITVGRFAAAYEALQSATPTDDAACALFRQGLESLKQALSLELAAACRPVEPR
jgi:hypothetical protein